MKIGIIGAMPEEIAPILEKVGEYKSTEIADNTYYEANYNGVDLVIAYSKIGKVFSTLTASTMIHHFGVEKMLFSGDHILPEISPNISLWTEAENPLESYLASLDKLIPLEVKIVLPGHKHMCSSTPSASLRNPGTQ